MIKNIQLPAIVLDTKKCIEIYVKHKLIVIDHNDISYKENKKLNDSNKGQNIDIYI